MRFGIGAIVGNANRKLNWMHVKDIARFVKESINDQKIHWGETNVPISEEHYTKIADAFIDFSKDKSLYLHNLCYWLQMLSVVWALLC